MVAQRGLSEGKQTFHFQKSLTCWEIKEVSEEGKLLIMIAHRIGFRKRSFQGGEGQDRSPAHTKDTRIWNITVYYAHNQPTPFPFLLLHVPRASRSYTRLDLCGMWVRLDFWLAEPVTVHPLKYLLRGVLSLSPTYSLAVDNDSWCPKQYNLGTL